MTDRYARTYIAYQDGLRRAARRVLQELASERSRPLHVAAAAWEEEAALHAPDEREMPATGTVEKKYCSLEPELDEKEMRRLYGYLGRRGFQVSDISGCSGGTEDTGHPVQQYRKFLKQFPRKT